MMRCIFMSPVLMKLYPRELPLSSLRLIERLMKILAITTVSALAFAEAAFAFDGSRVPSAPAGWLVNGVSNPSAIDRAATRFTWMSVDSVRGARQAAYQILVSSNAEH